MSEKDMGQVQQTFKIDYVDPQYDLERSTYLLELLTQWEARTLQ